MKTTHLLLVLMGLGMLLLACSFFLPVAVGGRRAWSDEQAAAHAKSSATLHRLSEEQGHALADAQENGQQHAHGPAEKAKVDPKQAEAALEEAQAGYDHTSAELRWAQSPFWGLATLLRWCGALCVLGGAAGYFALRAKAS